MFARFSDTVECHLIVVSNFVKFGLQTLLAIEMLMRAGGLRATVLGYFAASESVGAIFYSVEPSFPKP